MTEEELKKERMPHKEVFYEEDGTEVIGEECNGETYWEEGLEGYCCYQCNFYTGVK